MNPVWSPAECWGLLRESVRFDIFYGVSNNKWRLWDVDHAREGIGYQPIDNAEVFRGRDRI